ncbi:hypothetical protein JG688_00008960 [Phytophthora aleatoria]|uniref:RXLR phytopathogen effector protein WY-domain domain-containing protein n=1 Tax=Phytophthora aleatoria TaxID=2496075 RepID=A0A8J5MFJ7_9STRA|nr:hypothetical protein JG688_00008960 [Phytophthora aleatoria]
MRFVILLIIFLVGINLCSSMNLNAKRFKDLDHISINPLSGPRFFIATKKSDISKRRLRSYDAPKQDNIGVEDKIKEERAGVPGMTKLDELAYKMALKTTIDPMDIFKRLRVVKTDGRFWFSDDKLFDLLRKTKSEEELVTLFQSLRQ